MSSDNLDKLLPALAQAQAQYPTFEKKGKSHHGAFLDLKGIMSAITKPHADAGLIVYHLSDVDYTETRVSHVESGQFLSAKLRIDPELSEQSLGKALTYCRRYCLTGLLGIVADVDSDAKEPEDEQRNRNEKQQPPRNRDVAAAAGDVDFDKDPPRARTFWDECGDLNTSGADWAMLQSFVGAIGKNMGVKNVGELNEAQKETILARVKAQFGDEELAPEPEPEKGTVGSAFWARIHMLNEIGSPKGEVEASVRAMMKALDPPVESANNLSKQQRDEIITKVSSLYNPPPAASPDVGDGGDT